MSLVAAAVVFGVCGVAAADVAKPEDMAACNKAAQEAVRKGGAAPSTPMPNVKDERRAGEARRGEAPTDPTGTVTQSHDPQVEGMDAEGAKNPVYQAAYRACMRQSGF